MSGITGTKGQVAERELAAYLTAASPWLVDRMLRTGRADDLGDLTGIPDHTVQVKNYVNIQRAVSQGLPDLARQQIAAGTRHGVLFVRRHGRITGPRWIAVLPVDQWVDLATRALEIP